MFACVATQSLGLTSPPTLSNTVTAEAIEELQSQSALPVSLNSDQWMFTHDQLQQAAKILLPVSQRALVHAQIGAALSALDRRDEAWLQCLVYNLNESRLLGLRASREDDLSLSKRMKGLFFDVTLIFHSRYSQTKHTSGQIQR